MADAGCEASAAGHAGENRNEPPPPPLSAHVVVEGVNTSDTSANAPGTQRELFSAGLFPGTPVSLPAFTPINPPTSPSNTVESPAGDGRNRAERSRQVSISSQFEEAVLSTPGAAAATTSMANTLVVHKGTGQIILQSKLMELQTWSKGSIPMA